VIQIRLAGSGGQGIQFAAGVLAEAAAVYEGMNAIQISSFGPEARGGATNSDILISSSVIYHPRARTCDVLLAMTQQSAEKYFPDLARRGFFIVDSTNVVVSPEINALQFQITKIAREEIGATMTASVIGLGIVAGLTKAVSREAILKAIEARSPRRLLDVNRRALEKGLALAAKSRRRR